MDFEPPPRRKNSARKRARISEFPRKIRANTVGVPSARPPFGSFKTLLFVSGVVIRFRSNLFYQKFVRISTQSHIRALKRLCASHRAFPKEKDGMCEYKCGLGFAKLFSGERIRKTETNIFEIRKGFWISPPRRRGLGRNPRGLSFGFFGGRDKFKNTINQI